MIITEQHKTLEIGNEAIPFHLRRGKPNRVRLFFDEDMSLCIETSTGSLGDFDRQFVASKQRWILKNFKTQKDVASQKQHIISFLEQQVPILGEVTEIRFTPDSKSYFKYKKGEPFTVFAPSRYLKAHKKKVLYFALREFSSRFLERKVEELSKETESSYNRLRVKDHKSKWGSCSTLRNINLNWQLIFLEEELIDYVIIHELMHLREMNHSPRFWAWVEKYCPNYKKHRKQLKEKSWLIGVLN